MIASNDGGPAFPGIRGEEGRGEFTRHVQADGSTAFVEHNQGLSLRDYFAGQAIPAVLNGVVTTILSGGKGMDHSAIAKDCYVLADAMLAEREKRGGAS